MIGITFRQLQVFVLAAEAGSFRACAERLGVTQVSVSDHIRSLEKQLGRPLFLRRRGASCSLTADGRRAFERCAALLGEAESFLEEFARGPKPGARRRLVVGAPGYLAYRLSRQLADFGAAHPELALELATIDHAPLAEALVRGEVDVACFLALGPDPRVDSELLWHEPVGLYVGPEHPLAGRRRVEPAELRALPFVYLPPRSVLRGLIDEVLQRIGLQGCPVGFQTENMEHVRRGVKRSAGFACLFDYSVEPDVARGDLVRLPLSCALPALQARLAVRPTRRADRTVRELVAGIRAQRSRGLSAGTAQQSL